MPAGAKFEANAALSVRGGRNITLLRNKVLHTYAGEHGDQLAPSGNPKPGVLIEPFEGEVVRDIHLDGLDISDTGAEAVKVTNRDTHPPSDQWNPGNTTGSLRNCVARGPIRRTPVYDIEPSTAYFPRSNNTYIP